MDGARPDDDKSNRSSRPVMISATSDRVRATSAAAASDNGSSASSTAGANGNGLVEPDAKIDQVDTGARGEDDNENEGKREVGSSPSATRVGRDRR